MAYDFGPPRIDFSPLGSLGETYDRSRKAAFEQRVADARQKALAGFGQNGDLAALGTTLLQAGDLEGGMSALRIHAANSGTPWQRQRAAAEDARAADADAYRKRQEEENNRRYEETKTRADRPQRITEDGTDDYGNPTKREGLLFPDGHVEWRAPGAPDRRSGGAGDPNLPAPSSQVALSALGMSEPGDDIPPRPNNGYVIPGTLEQYPMGTVRMPKPDIPGPVVAPPAGRAAVAAPPPAATVPAQGAQPQQAPLAPPAPTGPTAVAAPPQGQAPIQRRINIDDPLEPETAPFVRKPPPNVNKKEWVTAETKRLQSLAGGEGPTTDMRNKLAKARQVQPLVERELNSLNELVQKHGTEYVPGETKARMQTTHTNLLMQLKELYGLGALQAKDIEMVENLLTDPTSSGWNPIEGAYKGLTQKGVTSAQVEKVKQIVRDGLIEAERNLGGDPTRVPEISRTTGGSSSYTSKSGVEVKW
jgi:hypothetical protein